ncbi:wall-associated receptor kinase-like protein, partial [Trifolium medium]|nr:wall-associated receptor kinase-like protein [Trifolium medium]
MTHFHISPTRNKLIAVGCDTVGIFEAADSEGNDYGTGCVAYCTKF